MFYSGKRICCGYDNGAIKVMDLKEGVSQVSLTGGGIGHTKAVTSIDTHQDNLLDQRTKLQNSSTPTMER